MRTLSLLTSILILCFSVYSKNDSRLKKINSEIKRIEKRINELKKEGASVLNELYRIELEFKKAANEKKRIDLNLAMIKKQIEEKKRAKKRLEYNIRGIREQVKVVLRILYKRGRVGNFKLFFNVKSIDQLFKNYRLFVSLINFNIGKIEEIRALISSLNSVEKKLREDLKWQVSLRRSREKKFLEISEIRSRKLDFVSRINSDRKRYLSMLSDLKKEAEKLNRVIRTEAGKVELPVIDLKKIRGNLNWPVSGIVFSKFGKTKSTRFNTYVLNNGIEIKPKNSAKIKSVFPGIIIFQNYFKGYGNIIIIQHSKDFLTVYGHCERFLKAKGDFISEGDVIGIVGDTGTTSGRSLYFEIRKMTRAVDPLKWLKKAN